MGDILPRNLNKCDESSCSVRIRPNSVALERGSPLSFNMRDLR